MKRTACSACTTGAAGSRRAGRPRWGRCSVFCGSIRTAIAAGTSATSTASRGASMASPCRTASCGWRSRRPGSSARGTRAGGIAAGASRPCFGELLQLDGSTHAWLRRCPEQKQTLIAVGDDATKRLLSAQLWPSETTHAVMSALRHVFTAHGLPIALYTDRAGWAFHTPKAGGRVDRTHRTPVGRALADLGIEHIAPY